MEPTAEWAETRVPGVDTWLMVAFNIVPVGTLTWPRTSSGTRRSFALAGSAPDDRRLNRKGLLSCI